MDVTDIYCNNERIIKMIENPMFHDQLKSIEIKFDYIWDMVNKGDVELQYLPVEEQVIDVLTNPLYRVEF